MLFKFYNTLQTIICITILLHSSSLISNKYGLLFGYIVVKLLLLYNVQYLQLAVIIKHIKVFIHACFPLGYFIFLLHLPTVALQGGVVSLRVNLAKFYCWC